MRIKNQARPGTQQRAQLPRQAAGNPSHTNSVLPLGEEIEKGLADLVAGPLGLGHDGRRRVSAGRKIGISRTAQRRGPRSPVKVSSSGVCGGGVLRWGQRCRVESRKGLGRGGGGRGGVVAARRGNCKERAHVGMSQGLESKGAPGFSGAGRPEGVPWARSQHGG